MAKLKALIFDVDGTLAETERDGHRVAFNQAFQDAGLDWNWDVETYDRLLTVFGGKERIRHFIEEFHPVFDFPPDLDGFIARLHAQKTIHYLELLKAGAIPLRPGVERLVNEAKSAGLKLAIASTTTPENASVLLRETLGKRSPDWFDVIACGDIVPRKKPAPDIYEFTVERLGVDASECLVIEDSQSGLASATAADLKTVITVNCSTSQQNFRGAAIVLSHLGEPGQGFEVLEGDAAGATLVDIPFLRKIHASGGKAPSQKSSSQRRETPLSTLLFLSGCLVAFTCFAFGDIKTDSAAARFSNPVISGFAPDPSICRSGDDFYLVNSTFEYFPGIPVYHSPDLVNWNLLSYAIHDPSQADLASIKSSDGIHASTIRCHESGFYVITTNNVDGKLVNFIVKAENPAGPWSKPFVLDDAPGIDPSLFFDDDGRAWYVGNHIPPDPEFEGQAEIWLQELDLSTMQLAGDKYYLWRGCCQGVWAEGPHIYKKDGYYYLLISEGGTSYEHALSVAISKNISGPYQNNPRNPVLSHRQLSYDHPITGVGHADLVELQDGRWYAVMLGWRLIDGVHGILGRETFLVPLEWETEPHKWKKEPLTFPVFSPGTGKVELHYPMPFHGTRQLETAGFQDEFDGQDLGPEWNFRRSPARAFHSLSEHPGSLRLYLQAAKVSERSQYSFTGVRQRHFQFEAVSRLSFSPGNTGEEAGLIVIQNDRSALMATLAGGENGNRLILNQSLRGVVTPLAISDFTGGQVYLRVRGDYLQYSFSFSENGEDWQPLGETVDGTALSPAFLGGFNYTGTYIGLYASANGMQTDNHADFEFFHYRPTASDRDDWYHRQQARQQAIPHPE